MKFNLRTQKTELGAVKSLKSLLLILSLFFFFQFSIFNSTFAQTYPVQVTPVISGPNLPYLSYYGDQNQHLNVFVLLTDFAAPSQNVRLKLSFTGPNLRFETNPFASSLPIYTLNPGEPLLITGTDLLPYLLEQNLVQTEGNAVDLDKLPEGFYTLCVDVIKNDVNAEILSTNNCRSFYIQEIQPPLLNLPMKFSQVDTTEQIISFLWTQPVNYTPNPSVEIRYHFKLYEWIDTTNFNIFATGQGLVYEEETNLNIQVINTAFDVYLRSGYKYIWQVQAKAYDVNTGAFLDLITQNGVSAPFWFTYGEKQSLQATLTNGLTLDLSAQAQNTRKGMAFWTITDETPGEGLSDYEAYIIEYRKFDSTGVNPFDWHSDTIQNKNFDIYQLEPAQAYEVRVSGLVGDYRTPILDTARFVTPPQVEYACNSETPPFSQTNYTPLQTAYAGMVFQLGQFELTVSEITALQQVGHYTGKGTIKHDFLGGAKCNVTFEDLLVDQEFVVREGEAQAVTDGAENWTNQHYLDMVTPYNAGGVIEAYGFLNDSTAFVVVGGDTLTYSFPENGNLPIVVQGANNVEIQFWPDGTIVVTTYGTSPSSDSLDANANRYAEFEAIAGQEKFFDKKQYDHFASNYELISCENNFNYFVSNTSKGTLGTTQVKAVYHVRTPGYSASGVSFKLGGGYSTVAHTQENDTTFVLTLPERSFSYDVYAFYGDLKIGKIRVVSLEQKERKVRIVPLVAISHSESAIEQAVNSIYAPANVTLDVKIDSLFSTAEFNAQTVFSDPEVDGMQKYTAQMRALRDAYKEAHELASNEYLLFVIPGFETAAIDGYMVRGKGLGFVKINSNLAEFVHTVTHELGHGMGGLSHAWVTSTGSATDESKKGLTTNLLDYSNGTKLIKAQWEDLNEAPNVVSMFDGEEDALGIFSSEKTYNLSASNSQLTYVYPHLYQDYENWIFRSPNGYYFKFKVTDYSRIEKIGIKNKTVREVVLINQSKQLLGTSIVTKEGQEKNNGLYFWDPADEDLIVSEKTFPNGETHEIIASQLKDIEIPLSRIIACENVNLYICGPSNLISPPLTCYPICPEAENDNTCNYTDQFLFDNPGSCSFRINRSSINCLKAITIANKIALSDVLINEICSISGGSSQTCYNKINFSELGIENHSYFPNWYNAGDDFDFGKALVRLMEAGADAPAFTEHLRQKITANNSQLIRKLLIDWNFMEVTFPFAQVCEKIVTMESYPISKETIDFAGNNFEVSRLSNPFLIQVSQGMNSNQSVLCEAFGTEYSANNPLLIYNENGTISSTTPIFETILLPVSKEKLLKLNGVSFQNSNNYFNTLTQHNIDVLLNGNPGQISFGTKTFYGKEFPAFYEFEITDDYNFSSGVSPLELMTFIFTENVNELGIEAGVPYIKPAIWGLCMQKAIYDYKEDLADRIITNKIVSIVGIVLSPFTAGGSLALTAISVGAAEYDLAYLEIQQNQSLVEYQNDASFRNAWNTLYTVIGIADGLVGGYFAVNSIADFYRATRMAKYIKASKEIVSPGFSLFVENLDDLNQSGKIVVNTWNEAVGAVDNLILPKTSQLNNFFQNAKIGYRGSLATGTKYSTGGPFDPLDWDVDAFIVSDNLAAQIGGSGFRNGRDISSVANIADELEASFKNISGYRTELNKPFTFRVFTEAEFNSIVKPNGYKLF